MDTTLATTYRRIFQVIDGNKKAVGDGFQVTSPMPGPRIRQLSPFLLIDHIGPMTVAPSDKPLGSPPHPHRGFETVTIMYQGVLAHRDTAGHKGNIGPGDVQWMTAGAGLMHEELYEKEFTRQGGTLEVVQLWVNMPKKDKMAPPNYQDIPSAAIKTLPTPDGKGTIRVIAGTYEGVRGPATTFSPMTMLDVHLAKGGELTLNLPADYNVGLYIVKGDVLINGDRPATTKQLVVLGWDSSATSITCQEDSIVLVLAGEPIEEPLATYGPFVMNTNNELVQAIADFESGAMGKFEDHD
ncbi:pirin family protein [Hymenobacter sp. BT770]|uniref:pirin family protein n=1 Tax=Hymenobacter sp. BT770 TaxID=2886942 RepID=UPI001D10C993|nr:pirin family protein [Hymenobacter sp. BT770]MCC3153324.1 pirin family protein [Hymenobacter sp. BT770]MDO3414319.1 pirin family protein [Hymenobacter sp. BT770]